MKNPKILASFCIVALVVCLLAGDAHAVITLAGQKTGDPNKEQHPGTHPVPHNCELILDPITIEKLTGPSNNCQTALGRDFSDWDITYNWTQPWTGTLTIDTYKAVDYGPHTMGAGLEAHYEHNTGDLERFRWVQIIITNDPATGGTSPYVDPTSGKYWDNFPFLYPEPNGPTDPPWNKPSEYYVEDYPTRPCPCLGHTWWQAELYLTDWYTVPGDPDDKNLIIYEGIRWGFDIVCVPEPATVCLLGLGSLLLVRRRRQRS